MSTQRAIERRHDRYAGRFLAETPEHGSHPVPTDEEMERRFRGCVRPARPEEYPSIRAAITALLHERGETMPLVGIPEHTHASSSDPCLGCIAESEAGTRTRTSFPNPARPRYWAGEENHYRSSFQLGDLVRYKYGRLGRIRSWNNTWSHVRAGRIADLEPLITYPGTELDQRGLRRRLYQETGGSWEVDLEAAQPGDIGAHMLIHHQGRPPWQPVGANFPS